MAEPLTLLDRLRYHLTRSATYNVSVVYSIKRDVILDTNSC